LSGAIAPSLHTAIALPPLLTEPFPRAAFTAWAIVHQLKPTIAVIEFL
jgi:hypothetical protein